MHAVSATELHPDTASVAATAPAVAGSEAWPEIAHRLNVNEVMLVDEAGRVQLTPGMASKVRFTERPASVKTVAIA